MNKGSRALIGALACALLMLFVHPLSRPFYLGTLRHLGQLPSYNNSPWLPKNPFYRSIPTTKEAIAYWAVLEASQTKSGNAVDRTSLRNLVALLEQQKQNAPDNAFWQQALACLHQKLGNESQAIDNWFAAVNTIRWDDFQNYRLMQLQKSLEADSQGAMAWHSALIYHDREDPLWLRIRRYGYDSVLNSDDLVSRVLLIQNGQKLRDGTRSIPGSRIGISMMERALRSTVVESSPSISQRLKSRQALLNDLRNSGEPELASELENAFIQNDAWKNVVDSPRNEEDRKTSELWSMVTATLPGASLFVAVLSAFVWISGELLMRFAKVRKLLEPPAIVLVALTLATLVYLIGNLIWPAMWTAACFAFFAFVPPRIRKIHPDRMTRSGRFSLWVVALGFVSCELVWAAGYFAPVLFLRPFITGDLGYLLGAPGMLGLGFLLVSLAIFSAPLWGVNQNYSPSQLGGLILRELGRNCVLASLSLTIIGGLCSILVDKQLGYKLNRIAFNEPGYHLSR